MPAYKEPTPWRRLIPATIAVAAVLGALPFVVLKQASAESAQVVPPPAMDEPLASAPGMETAVVAGGCFWGIQGVFQHVDGVIQAVSGYSGGEAATAHYQVVGSGATGHAESVQIEYDPSKITYGRLLQIFFSVALDPTQVNRQGPDYGTQYRSALFVADDEQAKVAQAYIEQLDAAHVFDAPIATEVSPLKVFYPAEDYHQDYATLHPDSGYIMFNDLPKIENLARLFPETYRDKPVLVSDAKRS